MSDELKVRAIKPGQTADQVVHPPGDEFVLRAYDDIDGNHITAEDQFSPHWMERADAEAGSRAAKERKAPSDGLKKAKEMAGQRLSLQRGETAAKEGEENAAIHRQQRQEAAQAGKVPEPPDVPAGKKSPKSSKDAI